MYDEPDNRGMADFAAFGGFSGGGGGGGYGPYMAAQTYWDPNYGAMAPTYAYDTAPGWQGFGIPQPGYGQYGQMFQQGGFNQAAAPAGGQEGAGQSAKAPTLKRKTICINCGAHDHVSYNPVCLNYKIHLQQLAAKAENMRKAAAAHTFSSTDRTVALRDGAGEIYK